MPPSFSPPAESGMSGLVRAIPRYWVLKMGGTTAIMAGFFRVYFQLLNHPAFPVTTMPLLGMDRWLAFRPEMLGLYLSLWFYVALAPALLTSLRELLSYGVATVAMGAVGLTIFYLWPTAVPVDYVAQPGRGFGLLRGIDAAGNACPSLHVAYAVFTACWFERILRRMQLGTGWRIANVLWGAGVVYSTLAVKQHVVLDVGAGAVLGAAVAAAHFAWLRRAAPARVAAVSAARQSRA